MEKIQSLKDLFIQQARSIYNAEKQKLEAFPTFRELASSPEVKNAVSNYIDETKNQVSRLDHLFSKLNLNPGGTHNETMECFLRQSMLQLEKITLTEVLDIAIVDCIQQINHYTIGSYGNIATYAEQLKYNEVSDLLITTLKEEVHSDRELTGLEKEHLFGLNGNGRKGKEYIIPKERLLNSDFLSSIKKQRVAEIQEE